MATQVPLRSEIPPEYTWDLHSIYADDAAWEAEIERVEQSMPVLAAFRGHLGDGPDRLVDWFENLEQLTRSLGKIQVYARDSYAVDVTDQVAAARNGRAIGIYARAMAAVAFAEPEMLAIGLDALRRWAQEEPFLAIYDHYFDTLERRQAHVRSAEVEALLNRVLDPFGTASATHGILTDADLAFPPAHSGTPGVEPLPVVQGTINALLTDPDREVRRTAWESYSDMHLAFKNTMAGLLAAGIKQDVFMAQARAYGSSLEAAVSRNHIPVQVFHNVVETFRRNLPVWHRYWRLRRQVLGYDRLHVYDIKAPLMADKPRVPYAQAIRWICDGMRPLGEEYVRIMRRGLEEERWVDVYPSRGKGSGAYSSGRPGTRPFVCMSYNDDLFSVSTLAHELGHSLHSYYAWQTQPLVYCDYSIFVAEVASNFNQALVREHLFRTLPERELQIALIEEVMSNFHRYLFVMPTLARFELETHQRAERGQALTAETMIGLMADLFHEGYGEEVEFDAQRIGITWAEFPHHLYSNFYVYQYVTGISAAHALADRVLSGEPGAVERYLAFLKAGDSLYPLDALKLAGVDMASPEPVERGYASLTRTVDRLEELLG